MSLTRGEAWIDCENVLWRMFLRTFLKYVDCSSMANIAGCKMAIIADMMRVTS